MLKKITVDQLQVGMYLQGLCGNWVDHPFWKSKFLLHDVDDLQKLRTSGVRECWIDVAKGLDVVLAHAQEARATLNPVVPVVPVPQLVSPLVAGPVAPVAPVAPSRVPIAEELRRAASLVNQSRQQVISLFQEARMGHALQAEACRPLVAEIAASVWRNPGALISLARLKTHHDYTYLHSVAVCALMVSLAQQLGQGEAESRDAGLAGLLHDMGKAAMPTAVLNKPGKLTAAEFQLIKNHPALGHGMLLGGSAVPAAALDVCLHHHERPDGRGYPHGLAGDALSTVAKMGAVCDVYDAVTSMRPYKDGWDPAEAIAKMSAWARDGQFDPAVFRAFVMSLGVYPIGSLVRMQSGRLAVVVEQTAGNLVKPRVKVFYSTRMQMPVAPELLDTSLASCTDQISARESNAVWNFPHLDELWAGSRA